MILSKGMPVSWTVRKTTPVMTGGMMEGPVDATASIAPAICAGYPARFIIEIVRVPTVATLLMGPPVTMPMKPLPITANFAGPPRVRPEIA